MIQIKYFTYTASNLIYASFIVSESAGTKIKAQNVNDSFNLVQSDTDIFQVHGQTFIWKLNSMCNENSFEPYISISIVQTPSTTQTHLNKDLLWTLI